MYSDSGSNHYTSVLVSSSVNSLLLLAQAMLAGALLCSELTIGRCWRSNSVATVSLRTLRL
jgi:hypothetical protein